jgi:asparagine synthetase B (glutamine-hydrolysing)
VIHRDPLGARIVYYNAAGRTGERARPLCDGQPRLDREGVRFAWGEGGQSQRSCMSGVYRLAPGHRLRGNVVEAVPLPPPPPSLEVALLEALAPLVDSRVGGRAGGRFALWLSGGVDSALLLALVRELGAEPRVYVLQPEFARDYDESEAALEVARALSFTPIVVRASAEDFVRALPACIRSTEAPLWNLHPVARRILAERTRADGLGRALTGDGADEAFAFAFADDYLPLVNAIARDAGVSVASPFVDDRVVAFARAHAPDPKKLALRALAKTRLPAAPCERETRARLAPPLDVSRFYDGKRAAHLAGELSLPPPRNDVKWATLLLLASELGAG